MMVIINVTRVASEDSNKWIGDLQTGFNPKLRHFVPTKNIYFRMHGSTGQYTGKYDSHVFQEIFNYVDKKLIDQAFIYFNNTDSDANAFKDAVRMTKKFNPLNLVKS